MSVSGLMPLPSGVKEEEHMNKKVDLPFQPGGFYSFESREVLITLDVGNVVHRLGVTCQQPDLEEPPGERGSFIRADRRPGMHRRPGEESADDRLGRVESPIVV
jgi:hypothetical protein